MGNQESLPTVTVHSFYNVESKSYFGQRFDRSMAGDIAQSNRVSRYWTTTRSSGIENAIHLTVCGTIFPNYY